MVDALAAAQALSEIGYLLRQQEKERFRAKAFSAAAWALALQQPDIEKMHGAETLTSIEGVGAGIARVLADLVDTGESRYLNRLRELMQQPSQPDETALDFADYRGDLEPNVWMIFPTTIKWTLDGKPLADFKVTYFRSNPYIVFPVPSAVKATK